MDGFVSLHCGMGTCEQNILIGGVRQMLVAMPNGTSLMTYIPTSRRVIEPWRLGIV